MNGLESRNVGATSSNKDKAFSIPLGVNASENATDEFVNESNNALNAWDGTNAKTGAQVADGIYTYILNVSVPSTEAFYETKGSITIVR